MGNKQGKSLGGRLTPADVARLQRRFQRLAATGGGTVSIPQFQSMVELGGNPFISRIFQLFDSDKDNRVTLAEFTQAIEYFGRLDQEEEQYNFAFRIYDVDGDGHISGEELYRTLHQLVGQHYTDTQLEQVVHNTMMEFDRDGDNMLNLEEFRLLLSSTDLQNKFAMSL